MRGFNFNISSLFGSLGSGSNNNAFSGFNYSDYASIKNGSYRKLLKSYYGDQKKEVTSDKSNDKNNTNKTQNTQKLKEDFTGLSKMKKEADGLKSSLEKLGKEDLWKQNGGAVDMDKVAGAVKDFVKEYNEVLEQSSKVSSKEITQTAQYMKSMTSTMSKALSKVGISVASDGALSVNEDTLKQADTKALKSLFAGAVSYGSQIADKAGDMSRDALMNSSMYAGNGALTSSISGMFDKWI